MKIKIIRSKFIEGLKKVQSIVAGKGSLQIIQNAMLEAKEGKLSFFDIKKVYGEEQAKEYFNQMDLMDLK